MNANRNVPMDYLRLFLTLLVVAHHAVLAYHPYAPARPKSLADGLMWGAFPVIDAARWKGIDLFVSFNDVFFMSLMFLISGLFVWSSLARKGGAAFVRDRAQKLGIGFVVSAMLFAPLAYAATYVSIAPQRESFWRQWLSLDARPAGPAWFLWVLLAFTLVAPLFRGGWMGRVASVGDRPIRFFAIVVAISAIAYLPMAVAFDPFRWVNAGPFFVQISRLGHYFVYFLAGMALGAFGVDRGLLESGGRLARRWMLWSGVAVVAFLTALVTFLIILSTMAKGGPSMGLRTFGNFTFVLACAASSFAFLALFVRFARRRNRVADSLTANAFGIYLVHYFCVTWLQLALLDAPLPGSVKGVLVTVGAILAAWGLSAAGRYLWSAGLRPRQRFAPVTST